MAKLKVYVTPIGFHDAYVAAPSQKAALEAWGSDADLFARKVASVVTDAKLSAEPLASPGTVIKRLRGTKAEQIAALPKAKPKPKRAAVTEKKATPEPPDRSELDEAEAAVERMKERAAKDEARLEEEIAARQERLKALRKENRAELERLEARAGKAKAAYQAAKASSSPPARE